MRCYQYYISPDVPQAVASGHLFVQYPLRRVYSQRRGHVLAGALGGACQHIRDTMNFKDFC